MAKAITVNGQTVEVLNTLSSGPGCAPHTYELRSGSYVYSVGQAWMLQERGQFARPVTVVAQ